MRQLLRALGPKKPYSVPFRLAVVAAWLVVAILVIELVDLPGFVVGALLGFGGLVAVIADRVRIREGIMRR
jgi:hypothetical protein